VPPQPSCTQDYHDPYESSTFIKCCESSQMCGPDRFYPGSPASYLCVPNPTSCEDAVGCIKPGMFRPKDAQCCPGLKSITGPHGPECSAVA
jgi:hypothetical protein